MRSSRKKAKKDREVVTYSDQVSHQSPGLVLFFNFHHAHIDCFNLITRRVLSEQMCLTTQEGINHLTFIESTFSGTNDISDTGSISKNHFYESYFDEDLPIEKMKTEAKEALITSESICKQFGDDIHTLVIACDFQYLIEIHFFENIMKEIDFLKHKVDRLKIMSTATAPYLPYFYDIGIYDFESIPNDVYVSLIRQGIHRTDAILLRHIDGQFKIINMINRFKERGFSEEETVDLVDTLRTIQNNILTDCYVYILELKKTSSFPVFKKVLDGKNALFLPFEPVRSEIVERYFERMGIDLDIYAEKDDEQQKLNGRYAVTMQGNLKQISNQQRFIDKSRFPLKRAPPLPGKRLNTDPYAETSMSPLQYIRFLRSAKNLSLEKQPRRIRNQELEEPGSADETPPMDIVEAMCADQIEQEINDEEDCLNFDDAWLKEYGELAKEAVFKPRILEVPVVNEVLQLHKPKKINRQQRKKKKHKSVPINKITGENNDPPPEDDVPEGVSITKRRKITAKRSKDLRKVVLQKTMETKLESYDDQDQLSEDSKMKEIKNICEESQPGPSGIKSETLGTVQSESLSIQTIKTEIQEETLTTPSISSHETEEKPVRKRPGRGRPPNQQQKIKVEETSKNQEEQPKLRRSTRAAAKTATAKIAIVHLPQKFPALPKHLIKKIIVKKPKEVTINGSQRLKSLFPYLAEYERKEWVVNKDDSFENAGYERRKPILMADSDYLIGKIIYKFLKNLVNDVTIDNDSTTMGVRKYFINKVLKRRLGRTLLTMKYDNEFDNDEKDLKENGDEKHVITNELINDNCVEVTLTAREKERSLEPVKEDDLFYEVLRRKTNERLRKKNTENIVPIDENKKVLRGILKDIARKKRAAKEERELRRAKRIEEKLKTGNGNESEEDEYETEDDSDEKYMSLPQMMFIHQEKERAELAGEDFVLNVDETDFESELNNDDVEEDKINDVDDGNCDEESSKNISEELMKTIYSGEYDGSDEDGTDISCFDFSNYSLDEKMVKKLLMKQIINDGLILSDAEFENVVYSIVDLINNFKTRDLNDIDLDDFISVLDTRNIDFDNYDPADIPKDSDGQRSCYNYKESSYELMDDQDGNSDDKEVFYDSSEDEFYARPKREHLKSPDCILKNDEYRRSRGNRIVIDKKKRDELVKGKMNTKESKVRSNLEDEVRKLLLEKDMNDVSYEHDGINGGITVDNGSHFNFLNWKPSAMVKKRINKIMDDSAKVEKLIKHFDEYKPNVTVSMGGIECDSNVGNIDDGDEDYDAFFDDNASIDSIYIEDDEVDVSM